MKILAIDPSSNKAETSTTGIVLLDNARLENHWIILDGTRGIKSWWEKVGQDLEFDVCVVEKYELRDGDASRDNSVLEVISELEKIIPDLILQRNAGYASDVPDELLKELGLWKFEKSHHNDVRAAARLGLFWAMRNDVEEVITDIGGLICGKLCYEN